MSPEAENVETVPAAGDIAATLDCSRHIIFQRCKLALGIDLLSLSLVLGKSNLPSCNVALRVREFVLGYLVARGVSHATQNVVETK